MNSGYKCVRFTPVPGESYIHRNGEIYKCLTSGSHQAEYSALIQNTATGWCFYANGCNGYEDGTFDWDYSTGGYFNTETRTKSEMENEQENKSND